MGGMFVVDWLGVIITNLLGLASDLIIRSTLLSSGVWLVLMIPWLWLRGYDWPELLYATAMTILFWAAMIPEWREVIRLKRAGELDKLQHARDIRVASRLDGGTARQYSASDLLGSLIAVFRRKDAEY
jgi:hypothetical protein